MFFYDYRAKGCINAALFVPLSLFLIIPANSLLRTLGHSVSASQIEKRIKHEYFLYFLNKNSVLFKKYTNFAPVLNKYTKE
jgi:hypothetical protein